MNRFSKNDHRFQKSSLLLILGLCLTFSLSEEASAVPVTFFGEDLVPGGSIPAGGQAETARNNFLSNLAGVGTEDFETFAAGDTLPISITFPGAGTATLAGSGLTADMIFDTPGAGRFATSGTNYLEATSGFNLTFDQPVVAFGFYGTDIGDFNGQITIALDNGENFLVPNTVNGPDSSLLFFGVIDMASFTSVMFGNTTGAPPFTDVFGFDDMTVGSPQQVVVQNNPVPEPGTFLLLGSGLAGIAIWRARRNTI